MATTYDITLDDAIKASKDIDGMTYLWIVLENVLDLQIPHYSIGSIGVTWNIINKHYTAAAELHPADENGYEAMLPLKDGDPKYFENLDELRNAFPKLFEVKGEFRVLNRR